VLQALRGLERLSGRTLVRDEAPAVDRHGAAALRHGP
jgi:hypothetical protein